MLLIIKDQLGIHPDNVEKETVLNHWIQAETNNILLYINETELPQQLEYLVIDGVVKRYRQEGSEGMKEETVEGNKAVFESHFDSIKPILNIWMMNNKRARKKRSGFYSGQWGRGL